MNLQRIQHSLSVSVQCVFKRQFDLLDMSSQLCYLYIICSFIFIASRLKLKISKYILFSLLLPLFQIVKFHDRKSLPQEKRHYLMCDNPFALLIIPNKLELMVQTTDSTYDLSRNARQVQVLYHLFKFSKIGITSRWTAFCLGIIGPNLLDVYSRLVKTVLDD